MHESSLLKENLTVLKEEAEVSFFVGWRFDLLEKKVKDGEIEELTREIQMYYGIKRHIEELTKENQVMVNSWHKDLPLLDTWLKYATLGT